MPDFYFYFIFHSVSQNMKEWLWIFFNILHNYKFMARFWLNLGWDDCHFVHLLLTDKSPLWSGLQNKKFLKKTLMSHSLHASCNNYNVRALCTLYLGTKTYIVFSLLLLQTTIDSVLANFSWCCNNYACNAVPSRTLTTTYCCVCTCNSYLANLVEFLKKLGKKQKKRKKKKQERIWQH